MKRLGKLGVSVGVVAVLLAAVGGVMTVRNFTKPAVAAEKPSPTPKPDYGMNRPSLGF